eukprot:COSAG01_NODE_42978_length_434_cov_1.385075_1_plen_46_part_10
MNVFLLPVFTDPPDLQDLQDLQEKEDAQTAALVERFEQPKDFYGYL